MGIIRPNWLQFVQQVFPLWTACSFLVRTTPRHHKTRDAVWRDAGNGFSASAWLVRGYGIGTRDKSGSFFFFLKPREIRTVHVCGEIKRTVNCRSIPSLPCSACLGNLFEYAALHGSNLPLPTSHHTGSHVVMLWRGRREIRHGTLACKESRSTVVLKTKGLSPPPPTQINE